MTVQLSTRPGLRAVDLVSSLEQQHLSDLSVGQSHFAGRARLFIELEDLGSVVFVGGKLWRGDVSVIWTSILFSEMSLARSMSGVVPQWGIRLDTSPMEGYGVTARCMYKGSMNWVRLLVSYI